MDTTLLLADLVVTLDDQDTVYRDGYVRVADGRIVEVGSQQALGQPERDGATVLRRSLVMPGLVNAHTHTPMVLFRGHAEGHSLLTLDGWYNAIRVLEAELDASLIPAAVAVSCAEMIRTGTTCFADQYFYTDQIIPEVRRSGLRAALAYGIVQLGDAEAGRREIGAAAAFLEAVQGEPRISGWIGPHAFFVDNNEEAIRAELELADRYQAGLHIHFATTGEEEDYCRAHYQRSAVAQMQQLGILDRRVLAAHCLSVPHADLPTLAAHPFGAVMCASAAMRSGVEPAALKAMLAAGVATAIGSDNVSNNNSYDLFGEMGILGRLMALRERKPGAVDARTIVRMATRGGAQVLGMDDQIGSLEPGKRADLIALDLNEIGWGPLDGQDIYTALVYAVSGMHVRDVMVDGVWLLRERAWTTIDYAAARAQLEADHAELQRRLDARRA